MVKHALRHGGYQHGGAFADFGNSLFTERCGVQATVWCHLAPFGPVDNRPLEIDALAIRAA
jgi:hypothetical protein